MADRVTIQDIADELGLSRNTVSKAINNTGVLADATREKILQKAIEMGYKQFSYVSMASGGILTPAPEKQESDTSGTVRENKSSEIRPQGSIALLSTIFLGNSHFSSTMLDYMQSQLTDLGYSMMMHRVSDENIRQQTLPNSLDLSSTAAILCFEIFDSAYSSMICDLGLPTLFVDAPADVYRKPIKSDKLLMDNRTQIHAFIEEMARRKIKKIGFVGHAGHCLSFYERYSATKEAMSLNGIPYEEKYSITGSSKEDYRGYLIQCLQNMEELPEVFICANDFIAIDLLQVFQKLNISVPKDVWLCGFDDSQESRITTPRLTTIHIHSQIMGFSAIDLLLSRIKNPSLNYRTIYTETSLKYRESTEH